MDIIDINANKLLDWLISRRHVGKDWQARIVEIRARINDAIQDMPVHDGILALVSGQHINYFHCLKIVEILKETEADTKNLFGRYGSQRMKDWQQILGAYQKDNVYLAEVAQMLIRNVNFEVTSLRKQVAKYEQIIADCEKRNKDYVRAENTTANDFHAACKQLGISGKHIRKELLDMLKDLPALHTAVAKIVVDVKPALEVYTGFVSHHCGKEQLASTVLPLLCFIIENGDTTTYEYSYGEKPLSVEEPALNVEIDASAIQEVALDADDDSTVDVMGEIDWGATVDDDEGFELVDHVEFDVNLEESGIIVENTGNDGGVARGTDAYTLLDNPKTCDQITHDLMELEMFLQMRMYEMSNTDTFALVLDDTPAVLQMQTLETITVLLNSVRLALGELTDKRLQHLHNIRHSNKYVDLLTASLNQKLEVIERMQASKAAVQRTISESLEEIAKTGPTIAKLCARTKELQREIEADISKRYDNRPVQITGAVNQL